jgi:hypothetical protein
VPSHTASSGLGVAFANTESRVRVHRRQKKSPPLGARWATNRLDSAACKATIRRLSAHCSGVPRSTTLEVVCLGTHAGRTQRHAHSPRRLLAHFGHTGPVSCRGNAARYCRAGRIRDTGTACPQAGETHGHARAGAKLPALIARRNARSSVHCSLQESQPEKEKVASPMLRGKLSRRKSWADAFCAHQLIHHRDATPCKQSNRFGTDIKVSRLLFSLRA